MSDISAQDWNNLQTEVAKQMDGTAIPCPHCQKEIHVAPVPKLAEKNRLTMVLTLQEGHKIQAETVGSTMVNFARMMKATAKHLGGTVEVFLDGFAIEGQDVRINFLTLVVPPKTKARRRAGSRQG